MGKSVVIKMKGYELVIQFFFGNCIYVDIDVQPQTPELPGPAHFDLGRGRHPVQAESMAY